MTITVPASSSTASPVLFQGRASTSQTLAAANTAYPVLLALEDFDDASGHSTTTNTSRLVATAPGRYLCTGGVLFGSGQAVTAGTTQRLLRLARNGSFVPGSSDWQTYTSNGLTLATRPVTVSLGVGDYVELSVAAGLAGAILYSDSTDCAFLRVERTGPL